MKVIVFVAGMLATLNQAWAVEDHPSKVSSQASIINGTDWVDVEGRPIAAHEGDIARFNGVFYWYGGSYANNPQGKFDIADGPVWNGVQVYRSTDLKNWTYKGVALPRPENGWGELGATGRSHVLYNRKTKKYVMWYRWYLKTWSSQVTDLFYLKESDTVVALCDQWWIPDKSDINKSRYFFLPVHLDPETGEAKMVFHEKLHPFRKQR